MVRVASSSLVMYTSECEQGCLSLQRFCHALAMHFLPEDVALLRAYLGEPFSFRVKLDEKGIKIGALGIST